MRRRSNEAAIAAGVDSLFGLFAEMRQSMQALLTQDGPTGLAPMHLRVLQLCKRDPTLTNQILVQRTGRDKAQIARLVKDLCEGGMLERVPSLEDKRSHTLTPTSAGIQACERFEALGAVVGRQLFSDWHDERLMEFVDCIDELNRKLVAKRAPR